MRNLKKLILNSTRIHELPPMIGRLENLEILRLDSNYLRDLPTTLQFCQKLTELSLANNNFTNLPGMILKLKNLKVLRAHDNPFIWSSNYLTTATPTAPMAATSDSICVASLQDLCTEAVFMYHIEYWKQGRLGPLQCKTLDCLVSTSHFCDCCGLPNRTTDYATVNTHQFCFEDCTYKFPFLLRACSVKCHKKLIGQNDESTDIISNEKKRCCIM